MGDIAINLVAYQKQIVFFRQCHDLFQNFFRVNHAGRVVRIDDQKKKKKKKKKKNNKKKKKFYKKKKILEKLNNSVVQRSFVGIKFVKYDKKLIETHTEFIARCGIHSDDYLSFLKNAYSDWIKQPIKDPDYISPDIADGLVPYNLAKNQTVRNVPDKLPFWKRIVIFPVPFKLVKSTFV